MTKDFTETADWSVKEISPSNDYVYDCEVENVHTFVANDILVHNSVYISLEDLLTKEQKKDKAIYDRLLKFADGEGSKIISNIVDEFHDDFNVMEKKMVMSRENVISSAIFIKKKFYCMHTINEGGVSHDPPKLTIKGIRAIKVDVPAVCKVMLKELIVDILNGEYKAMYDKVIKFRKAYKKLPLYDIGLSISNNKMADYTPGPDGKLALRTPMGVKASLMFNNWLDGENKKGKYTYLKKISGGNKVKAVYLKKINPVNNKVIGFTEQAADEIDKNFRDYVDWETQFEKSFMVPLEQITDVVAGIDMRNTTAEGKANKAADRLLM